MEHAHAPIVGKCRGYGWSGDINSPILRCGECGVLDVELVGGKELYLEHLEVEVD